MELRVLRYFKTVILCRLNGLYYGRREVGSRNKINVMDAGGLSFQHYFRKSPDAYFLAEIIGADVVILTEYASKGTSGKKYSAGSPCSAYGRLLPVMDGGEGGSYLGSHFAISDLTICPVGAAVSGT